MGFDVQPKVSPALFVEGRCARARAGRRDGRHALGMVPLGTFHCFSETAGSGLISLAFGVLLRTLDAATVAKQFFAGYMLASR